MISIVLMVTAVQASETVVLADSLSDYNRSFEVLANGTVLYIDNDGELTLVSIDTPMKTVSFLNDWNPEEHGWANPGMIICFDLSPDGEHICFCQQVSVPDNLQTGDQYIPGPVLVAVCRADGTGARPLVLSFEVGSGPHFRFTQDSRHIFGSPLLECPATPEDFASFVTRDNDNDLIEGYIVDIQDDTRSGGNGGTLGDGFYKNPWSNLIATGSYPTDMIADAVTGEVFLHDTTYSGNEIISNWVLPDAGLAEDDQQQILRYSDGTEVVNPGEPVSVFGRLEDGRYVFSRGGTSHTVLSGHIDWTDFSSEDAETLSGLEDFIDLWTRVAATPDGKTLIFSSGSNRELYRYDLP
ncbi:hypothetical protein DRQ25_13785 [Candidatus Fermentibacteria bacterium]|nr:MAG: hypothetical protein DRQ25_13785 [Candidatus Fermentibacteria bacterium]